VGDTGAHRRPPARGEASRHRRADDHDPSRERSAEGDRGGVRAARCTLSRIRAAAYSRVLP
jgi:hypothetical protein